MGGPQAHVKLITLTVAGELCESHAETRDIRYSIFILGACPSIERSIRSLLQLTIKMVENERPPSPGRKRLPAT